MFNSSSERLSMASNLVLIRKPSQRHLLYSVVTLAHVFVRKMSLLSHVFLKIAIVHCTTLSKTKTWATSHLIAHSGIQLCRIILSNRYHLQRSTQSPTVVNTFAKTIFKINKQSCQLLDILYEFYINILQKQNWN